MAGEIAKTEEPLVVYEEDDERGSKETVLQKYFLQEWKLVKYILDDIVFNGRVSDLSSVHRIRSIMDKYQEQGQLLEPYLESIVSPLMLMIRSKTIEVGLASDEILEVINPLCIIIYSLVTVCGYKAVVKFFPHQVSDLELSVSLLEKCHGTNSVTSLRQESGGEMEAKCVILLWLSILVLVPFDISSIDSSISIGQYTDVNEPPPLVMRMVGICKDYLSTAGPMRSIAGLLLSRLLTRPDMPNAFISFLDWTHEVLSSVKDDVMDHFRVLGVVEALAAIFKAGSRKMLLIVVSSVWSDTLAIIKSTTAARSPLLRKSIVKLTQRIGLTCLPRRSPQWCYVGNKSSLRKNMSPNASSGIDQCSCDADLDISTSEKNLTFLDDENMDVPDMVEEIIELLLTGLRDTDTVVRWSAAKGVGRITSRLTSSLADEVLSSVLELFSPGEGDGSWHGGCLALAELARRGLLLPISLPRVVPFVVKALHYDIRRGPHSVGSHVRDAAAYVCWAFGRAYYQNDMRNILNELAPHLLAVACYDREVNCRRAAAAAFQENVGRQGNYPRGIEIVNTADYFLLASRVNSYMNVAVSIAQYDGYLYLFVEELLYNKICHWDKGLRELAAKALSSLVKYDVEYFANFVMEKIIPCTLSSDLCTRHGATLAAGEIVLAIHQCGYSLPIDKQKEVAGVVPAIEKARLYRGKGGEIMRAAVSRFIECLSAVHLFLSENTKRKLLDTLSENLRHPNSHIQNAAVEAIRRFLQAYFITGQVDKATDLIMSKYLEQLVDPNVAARRGSALALGVLPINLLVKDWKVLLMRLCSSCLIEDNPEDRDAEARVNSIKGLLSVCEILTEEREDFDLYFPDQGTSLFLMIKNEVMQSLLKALNDYSVDNRGDVGSWVREAAMEALERCTYILCKRELFDANLAIGLVSGIVKQAVEKMDKLREVAAKVLHRILYNDVIFVPSIPYREKLEEIIPNKDDLKWAVPTFSYPRFVQLLQLNCYSRSVLCGLVISIGGLQDFLRKASLSALLDYLQGTLNGESIMRECTLSDDILWVLQQYRKCDRVIIPTLKTIEILFSKSVFLDMEDHTPIFFEGVLDSLLTELKGSKDFSKLYAGIAILGYIASVSPPVKPRAFSQLLTFLSHRYPKIRKACAEQVYLVLLQNEKLVSENNTERVLEIISDTCWEGDIEVVKKQKVLLYQTAGLESWLPLNAMDGVLSSSGDGGKNKPTAVDENASYSSLVGSSGF